jgi:predicted kinase
VVVLDANFRRKEERKRLRAAARDGGARLVLVECQVDDELIRARLRKRAHDAGSVSDADLEVYGKLKESYEAPVDEEAREVIRVASDREPGELVAEILGHLLARG